MIKEKKYKKNQYTPFRLWPGVIAAVFLLVMRFGVKSLIPGFQGFGISLLGSYLGIVVIVVWWMFFSRFSIFERCMAVVLMTVSGILSWFIKHESMGPLWMVEFYIPFQHIALVVWAVLTQQFSKRVRLISLASIMLLMSGMWALIRTEGIDGNHHTPLVDN